MRGSKSLAALAVAGVALAVAGLSAGSATAGAAPAASTASTGVSDGPGHYYVFRTLDSGAAPPAAQDAACNSYFGALRSISVVERLNARLYSFTSSPTSGFLTDQTAKLLGPGYLCLAPGFSGADVLEGYASTSLPGIGTGNLAGHCGIQPLVMQAGIAVVGCTLGVTSGDLTSGVATSSSVGNPLKLSGAPTGSVWTLYEVGGGGKTVTPPSDGGTPDTGNTHFVVGREVGSTAAAATSACPGGTRTTTLHPVSTDPASSEVVGQPSSSVAATATVCYSTIAGPDFGAKLTITVKGISWTASTSGHCRQQSLKGVTGSVQQSCAFALPFDLARGINGGLVTTNGLVPNGSAAGSTNSAVWSVSLLGGPAPTS